MAARAAGLLLCSGGRVLLAERSRWVDQGGTWAFPGGLLRAGEGPVAGAFREFGEELHGGLGGVRVLWLTVRHRGDAWSFVTVVGSLPQCRPFGVANWESAAVAWVPVGQVAGLRLLPDFARAWPGLRRRLVIETGC